MLCEDCRFMLSSSDYSSSCSIYIIPVSFLPLYPSVLFFLHSIASCSECALIFSKPFRPPAQLCFHLFLFLSDREEWAVCSPVRSRSHFPYMPPHLSVCSQVSLLLQTIFPCRSTHIDYTRGSQCLQSAEHPTAKIIYLYHFLNIF